MSLRNEKLPTVKIEKQIKEDRKNNLAELTKLSDSYEEIVHRS